MKLPGLFDPHVHLRGMDWSHKATFASETAAALAGGYTSVLDMPNTPPSTIDRAALDRKLAEIGAQAVCDWGVYFGASQRDNSTEFAGAQAEVCGLKIYNNATTGDLLIDDQTLRERLYAAWPSGKVIAVHAEGETVRDILALVMKTRKPTHFCHVSSAYEVGLLRAAKSLGLPVSVGVCPHHLYLTEDDLPTLGGRGLMKPGLKIKADQAALWQAIRDGVVDCIETDHAPHTLAEKQADPPAYGVPGLETALPLMLLAVKEGRISLEQLIPMLGESARRIFGVPAEPDTYTRVDLDASYDIRDADLLTAPKWSPFAGMRVAGRVREVWIRGRRVYSAERGVDAPPGSGRNLFGAPR